MNVRLALRCALVALVAGCSGGSGTQSPAPVSPSASPHASGAPMASPTPSPVPSPTASPIEGGATTPKPTGSPTTPGTSLAGLNSRLYFSGNASGSFYGNTIAEITAPRQLVAFPNGDLLVGTTATSNGSSTILLVPNADADTLPGSPVAFATIPDSEAQGLAYSSISGKIYVGTTHGVWAIPYRSGDRVASAQPVKIVSVRTGSVAPNSDGDVHSTTSVAVSQNNLYVGVGSSCNRCTEVDPTRAVVLRTDLGGGSMSTAATRFRNAIALTVNPSTGALWAGGAGQDCLEPTLMTTCPAQNDAYRTGHPFEFIDPVTTHSAPADYGWPVCEENHTAYASPAPDCSKQISPAIVAPAYSTIIGAAIYPAGQTGAYAFPSSYGGGLFMSFHGSWHETNLGIPVAPPAFVFAPLSGDAPRTAMNWSVGNPSSQWTAFLSGWQDNGGIRYGRPTGIAVGPLGSLFVSDDQSGVVYRIRPGTAPSAIRRR